MRAKRKVDGITVDSGKPDKDITLWNIVCKYVKKHHPDVPIDGENNVAACWRFRVEVSKNEVEITDSGKSPGTKAPEDFPRKTIQAADPDFFKKLSKALKKGNVCVYREPRKLTSNWIMLSAPDLVAVHNIDLEAELIGGLASEIASEIDKQIIEDMTRPLDIGDVMPPRRGRNEDYTFGFGWASGT